MPQSIPAYLIQVIPELKVDGTVVLSGSAMALGEDLPFAFSVSLPSYGTKVYPSPVVAGSYLSVGVIGGSVSPKALTDVKARLEATKTKLESQDQTQLAALTREDLLGDMFHAGSLGYYAEFTALGHIAALQQSNHMSLAPSAGTYGYVPHVTYFFGFPRSIEPGGVEMDLDRVSTVTSVDGKGHDQQVNFVFQLGALSSALEHAIPEQMFVTPDNPEEAVSAVKALSKAAAQGQRIYHITSANQYDVLPNIHHNEQTINEIRAALATGKEVITHTDAVSVPGWQGAGYVIYDPHTGDGAWKIGGGMNGAFLIFIACIVLALVAILLASLFPLAAPVLMGAASYLSLAGTIAAVFVDDWSNVPWDWGIFFLVTGMGTSLISIPSVALFLGLALGEIEGTMLGITGIVQTVASYMLSFAPLQIILFVGGHQQLDELTA